MKAHTSDFKSKIKEFGRELDSKITYTMSGITTELGNEQLNSVSPHYEGAILKSVMRQLDIDSNVEIPVDTEINYQFGIKIRNNTVLDYRDNYDYVDYGNYIVYSSEKQEDLRSYKIVCYDKMLYTMKDYENSNIVFPITVRNYINAICTKCGLTFADANKQFANYDKVISNEFYLDSDGKTLGYTFRDVLDELAQVTGGTICINENDQVEIRYIHSVGELTNTSGSYIHITDNAENTLSTFEIEGKTVQNGTPSPDNPIELVSVGYENLFDSSTIVAGDITGAYGSIRLSSRQALWLEPGTYIFSCNITAPYRYAIAVQAVGTPPLNTWPSFSYDSGWLTSDYQTKTFTLSTAGWVVISLSKTDNSNLSVSDISDFFYQLTKGTQTHTYISYGKYGIEVITIDEDDNTNTQLYVLDNPLRSIGNVKDKLYIENGYLYVERKIGSVIFDGSEYWQRSADYRFYLNSAQFNFSFGNIPKASSQCLSSHFASGSTYASNTIFVGSSSAVGVQCDSIQNVAGFTAWLSNNNNQFNYVLNEIAVEQLGSIELPKLYENNTYIETTDELEPTINVSYISNFEKIDEEQLKDVNVNFGEKFGQVNTIILSRGGDGDKISLSQPTSLPDADKIAIQITDNQIMNDNNRDQYMPDILSQLYGLEYYYNDFTSTGICYLDLCDRYKVKIGDNTYTCVMFNNSVEITQGLKEEIYTDVQEGNEQNYKYMSSTDRGITQANIIAKKAEGTIVEYTQRIDEDEGRITAVETKQTATDRTIDIISTHIDRTTGEVTEVTTTTGFTFNAEGMSIKQGDFEILQTPQGAYYKEGNNIVGQYTKDGSKQKDLSLFGVYYYGMDDINDTPMFVAELYTDESGEEAFGHFYNRGD